MNSSTGMPLSTRTFLNTSSASGAFSAGAVCAATSAVAANTIAIIPNFANFELCTLNFPLLVCPRDFAVGSAPRQRACEPARHGLAHVGREHGHDALLVDVVRRSAGPGGPLADDSPGDEPHGAELRHDRFLFLCRVYVRESALGSGARLYRAADWNDRGGRDLERRERGPRGHVRLLGVRDVPCVPRAGRRSHVSRRLPDGDRFASARA